MNERTLMDMLGVLPLDLRPITRKGAQTLITLGRRGSSSDWIECGPIEIPHLRPNSQARHIGARMGRGATDMEHDSAWAFQIPVVGLEFESISGNTSFFSGFIEMPEDSFDFSHFRVPSPGTDPFEGSSECPSCGETHPIVEYLPEANSELYRKVAGHQITIMTRPDEVG